MSDTSEPKNVNLTAVAELFRGALNRHGHSFQARVLKDCRNLMLPFNFGTVNWQLRATDMAVTVQQREYHIDGVLEASGANANRFVTLECKRADPALKAWCFARFTEEPDSICHDVWKKDASGIRVEAEWLQSGGIGGRATPIAHVGVEVNTGAKGDSTGKALKEAIDQAHRGASGLANLIPTWIRSGTQTTIVPMIVTTAALFVTRQPLEVASIETGDLESVPVVETPCLWLLTPLSASLLPSSRPGINYRGEADPVGTIVRRHSERAALIVNALHLQTALAILSGTLTNPMQ